MNIKDYITKNDIPVIDFAKKLGCTYMAVYYWMAGKRKPTAEYMNKIMLVTKGKVMPNDWFDIPDKF